MPRTYTQGMTTTTIKVTTDLRDRLKIRAAGLGLSLGDYLDRLVAEQERAERFDRLRQSIKAHPLTDEAKTEDAAWQDASMADLRE